jgi:hypothetical protein
MYQVPFQMQSVHPSKKIIEKNQLLLVIPWSTN